MHAVVVGVIAWCLSFDLLRQVSGRNPMCAKTSWHHSLGGFRQFGEYEIEPLVRTAGSQMRGQDLLVTGFRNLESWLPEHW